MDFLCRPRTPKYTAQILKLNFVNRSVFLICAANVFWVCCFMLIVYLLFIPSMNMHIVLRLSKSSVSCFKQHLREDIKGIRLDLIRNTPLEYKLYVSLLIRRYHIVMYSWSFCSVDWARNQRSSAIPARDRTLTQRSHSLEQRTTLAYELSPGSLTSRWWCNTKVLSQAVALKLAPKSRCRASIAQASAPAGDRCPTQALRGTRRSSHRSRLALQSLSSLSRQYLTVTWSAAFMTAKSSRGMTERRKPKVIPLRRCRWIRQTWSKTLSPLKNRTHRHHLVVSVPPCTSKQDLLRWCSQSLLLFSLCFCDSFSSTPVHEQSVGDTVEKSSRNNNPKVMHFYKFRTLCRKEILA